MFIKVREEDYYFSIFSDNPLKPYLILLHGFMGDSRFFNHLLEPLSDFCNPVTIDLLGHGSTAAPSNPTRYYSHEQVEDLSIIFRELNLPPFFLLGYSMGGRLAIQFAIQNNNVLTGLILESTTFGIQDNDSIQKRIEEDEIRANSIENDYRHFVEKWNQASLFQNNSSESIKRKRSLMNIQKNQRPHGLANSLRGFGTGTMPHAHDKLSDITVPTLIISGMNDEKFTTIGKEMNLLISNSSHVIIPNSNHRVHIDNPDLYLQQIKKFISEKQKRLL
ncbi:MAG TPA: 2-succinyl-6-hydroxy-2,4-cyclohexadiene-1-carboxylate synthase [Balneolales bacterium]|nr:2-succinyl-6-hydroxy-2,4-cyclohexadiene-1-carboxylate synthase [Balneolales bacterium]